MGFLGTEWLVAAHSTLSPPDTTQVPLPPAGSLVTLQWATAGMEHHQATYLPLSHSGLCKVTAGVSVPSTAVLTDASSSPRAAHAGSGGSAGVPALHPPSSSGAEQFTYQDEG